MKRGLVVIAFLLVIASLSFVSAACPFGMVSYWKFENNGIDSADSNPGTVIGTNANIIDGGILGKTLNISSNANSGWFEIPRNNNLLFGKDGSDFSLETWINPSSFSLSGFHSIIGGKTINSAQSGNNFALVLDGGAIKFWNWGSVVITNSSSKPLANQWSYIVLTRASNLYKIYLNGNVLIPNNCGAGTVINNGCSNTNSLSNNYSIKIGADYTDSYLAYMFLGKIDEVAIYNKSLTQAEITAHYNNITQGKDYCYEQAPSSTCPDNQTIMRLYQSNNSHVAVWNWSTNLGICVDDGIPSNECNGLPQQDCGNIIGCLWDVDSNLCASNPGLFSCSNIQDSNLCVPAGCSWSTTGSAIYKYPICYKDIFGIDGDGNHNCNGNNRVLSLNDLSNSHASVSHDSNYSTDVCYGNLICTAVTDPTPCSSGYSTVVRLYQANNSHVSNASFTNYTVKICCKSGADISGGYWSTMNNIQINTTDLNDSVKANVAGFGLSGEINYTIYKSVPFWWDKKVAQSSSLGFTTWKATFPGDYYFIAKLPDGTTYDSSTNTNYGILKVSDQINNSIPAAIILTPDAESKHLVNAELSFNQSIYDKDDDIKAIWSFDDGNITIIANCQTGRNCNTTHKYSDNGVKLIKLTAKENSSSERTQESSASRRIFLYQQGINVFPMINNPNPINEEVLLGNIYFNASKSYVANCSTSCPTTFPSYAIPSCYAVSDQGVTLWCYDLDNTKISPTSYNLWFNWTFDEQPRSVLGNWTNNYNQVVEFNRFFFELRRHTIKLLVGYEQY